MKKTITTKAFRFIFSLILTAFILVIYLGCQKENNTDSMKTEEVSKAHNPSSSSIVYTDVNPDLVVSTNGTTYNLDLDNDGIVDYKISFTTPQASCGQWCQFCSGYRTNSFINITPEGSNKAESSALFPNTLIDGTSISWNNVSLGLASKSWYCKGYYGWVYNTSGSWFGQLNKYLPLQIIVKAKVYYGWVRLDVTTGGNSFTIKDYAYNSNANQSMFAAQTQ
jgi:hypothetical protein